MPSASLSTPIVIPLTTKLELASAATLASELSRIPASLESWRVTSIPTAIHSVDLTVQSAQRTTTSQQVADAKPSIPPATPSTLQMATVHHASQGMKSRTATVLSGNHNLPSPTATLSIPKQENASSVPLASTLIRTEYVSKKIPAAKPSMMLTPCVSNAILGLI